MRKGTIGEDDIHVVCNNINFDHETSNLLSTNAVVRTYNIAVSAYIYMYMYNKLHTTSQNSLFLQLVTNDTLVGEAQPCN